VSIPAEIAVVRAGLDATSLDAQGVRLVAMPWMASVAFGRSVQAITLNRTIFIQPSMYDRVASGVEPSLLVHELIHVAQWRDQGIVGFTFQYVAQYARLRLLGVGHDAAYRGVSFEYAAFDAAKRSRRYAA